MLYCWLVLLSQHEAACTSWGATLTPLQETDHFATRFSCYAHFIVDPWLNYYSMHTPVITWSTTDESYWCTFSVTWNSTVHYDPLLECRGRRDVRWVNTTNHYIRILLVQWPMNALYTCTMGSSTTYRQCLPDVDPITVSLVGDILVFLITGKSVLSDTARTYWALVSRDEVAENIEGFSDVVYAVTLLTVGEVLLYAAIKKGRVHKC